jgi:hypothetical protein
MLDSRDACAYAIDHQKQLIREAEQERLVAHLRRNNSAHIVIWLGDLLIATGLRLKAAYRVDNAPYIETANIS